MKISVVTTMYLSAPHLVDFYNRLKQTLMETELEHEIIFVNDGSPDHSLDIAISLRENDSSIGIVDLSRNFGHHKALFAGLEHASGDLVFVVDCDLEEPPELLIKFLKTWTSSGKKADLIYGVQSYRRGNWFRRWSGELFFRLFHWMARDTIPRNVCMIRLMTRRFKNALLLHHENNVVISGLSSITGFKQEQLVIEKSYKGYTTYNMGRRLLMALNAWTSFSSKPLEWTFLLGFGVTTLSFIYVCYLFVRWLAADIGVDGWTSLIVSIWLVGGVTIFTIGLVGLYLARIFQEVKQRPRTIVRHFHKPQD